MSNKPIVAVVGRPNVGKSTFVNRIVGSRQSIVDDQPGVTRDRIYFDVEWQNKQFTLIDTGGIIPGDEDEIMLNIFTQAKVACDEADKIIFLVDGKDGINPIDYDIANVLRRSKKPVYLAVNKIDAPEHFNNIADFYALALGDPHPISALHGSGGVGDLLEAITEDFVIDENETDMDIIKLAIVGKPNAGKSSLLNVMVGEERAIVTEIAGTTRDTLEESIYIHGIPLQIIDTAGIRDTEDIVEKIGVNKAKDAVDEADLVLYVIDGSKELDENDREIMELVQGKKVITLLNKSDLEKQILTSEIEQKLNGPVISISAKEETGIDEFYDALKEMFFEGQLEFNDEIYITNMRHKTALMNAKESLEQVVISIENQMPEDFYSIDLMNAYEELGFIIGESLEEDLVNEIFREFCMGK